MALRIAGHGLPSRKSGGRAGDLFAIVYSAPDPRFERRNADLWRGESVTVADAALGASIDVPTLDGHVTVKIPPGTQPGAVLRVRDKALREFGGRGQGALYIVVRVAVPEKLSSEQRKFYEQLRKLEENR